MGDEIFLKEEKQNPNLPESSPGLSSTRKAVDLISSLISLSHSIRIFNVKWKLIRNKLEELNSGLIAMENCDFNDNNPEIISIVSALMVTINQCYNLARRCVDLSYSGKLLMQSDLNMMLSKFDQHTTELSEIYNAGLLTLGFAIVVSRPTLRASREDMKFYATDLETRMKIGDTQMKRQALVKLHEATVDDEKYVKVVVELSDIVNVLVNFLDSQEPEIQEGSVKLVSLISGFNSYKGILIGAGIIAPLIRVLECGNEFVKETAARCLMKLTENSDNAWSILAHGGVTVLLKICGGEENRAEIIGPSCGVLKNLIGVEEIKRFIIEEGAIYTFIKLTRSKDEAVQINSIQFLQNIAHGDELIRKMVVNEGVTRALIRVVEPRSACSPKVREIALRTIESLCFSSNSCIRTLMYYGFLDQLLYFLRNEDVSLLELALKVANRLCGISEEAKKAMGDAGFMLELVKFLESKSFVVLEMATELLSGLVVLPKNRKRFIQDDRNIGLVLKLLGSEQENSSGNKKLLLSMLMSLTNSDSGRRKIASSGYVNNIKKLAESEVLDAKKLVRKLSTNRFRSMISGIWHS